MRPSRSRWLVGAGVAAALLSASLGLAPVVAASTTQIGGVLVLDSAGACQGDPASLESFVVSGTLQGCWYIETSVLRSSSSTGGIWTGQELFVGCLGEGCGTFRTTYTFWASYNTSGAELHGHCHHDLVSGTGAFSTGSGSLEMHDIPDGTPSPGAEYSGHLDV